MHFILFLNDFQLPNNTHLWTLLHVGSVKKTACIICTIRIAFKL